ncbi:MAG: DUF2029 domain-containing protein [Chitinophagaceae bacterium]|nr:DUF2029 domain-containing protein [Chitinophagaceae bacterium]MCA6455105.1 DUF2029 domain-containing protein [Chitinophagaceae bacterium]MCA6458815.1 DUF2029 domain-containing protein [Chitinophagaceae bacterium]MCA6464323.1 DUF2029 domain-containing protein [Chitinophagaceae bacterium]MEA3426252.1 glycosyltransferase family 87 protein [Bacteroidota bacterium]
MNPTFKSLLFRQVSIGKSLRIELVHIIWFTLALVALMVEMARGREAIDNYLIFRGVFYHVLGQKNLFVYYPEEYVSFNNYGPAFSLVIAPFAVLPIYLGCFLWGIANATSLFGAIRMLPVKKEHTTLLYWIICIEMMTSLHNMQFNPMLTAFFIFAFVYTRNGKDWLATLFIAIGILTKIYGVAALVFFLFSKNKWQFIISLFLWLVLLVLLPMSFSSVDYIFNTYQDWYYQIIKRNQQNIQASLVGGMQDISVPGMIRRIFHYYQFPDLVLIAVAGILVAVPLLKYRLLSETSFQLRYLALALIGIVIFSSAAESPTFVIAVTGCAIWVVLQKQPFKLSVSGLIVFLFLLTILSPTDLIPPYIRQHFILAYSLKALPCFLIWCCLVYEVWQTKSSSNLQPV